VEITEIQGKLGNEFDFCGSVCVANQPSIKIIHMLFTVVDEVKQDADCEIKLKLFVVNLVK
jgi:hypothetical protein